MSTTQVSGEYPKAIHIPGRKNALIVQNEIEEAAYMRASQPAEATKIAASATTAPSTDPIVEAVEAVEKVVEAIEHKPTENSTEKPTEKPVEKSKVVEEDPLS